MNKKLKTTKDVSNPYRTLSFNKVTAPVKANTEPKCSVIKAGGDLRVKGGK